ncbi:MAG: gliding motility-associated C-terminal domain-containing protein, partial [Cytophagaceae bacterium]
KYFKNFEITIFSRWGEIIFYSNDRNNLWDGTYRGEPMPLGVYPYIITYEGEEEYKGPYKLEGSITVIR